MPPPDTNRPPCANPRRRRRGEDAIEYSLLVAMLASTIVIAWLAIGENLNNPLDEASLTVNVCSRRQIQTDPPPPEPEDALAVALEKHEVEYW